MAGASLLALIDDIATLLDDIAVMTKVAAKKTAGVLGDDLALNAQQVAGVRAERELPVVWAVALGSLKNKLILVPTALAISALVPWAILPLLMLGGLYLCFEGSEKIVHRFFHRHNEENPAQTLGILADPDIDLLLLEKEKIKGAIRTDFVLSAEIIVIALGTVAGKPFGVQIAVLSGIGLIMTLGVYGLVAGIVKMDDLGLYLLRKRALIAQTLGRGLLLTAPLLMKALTIVGTAAMFMVGGGILTHAVPSAHAWIHRFLCATSCSAIDALLHWLLPIFFDMAAGALAGLLALLVVQVGNALRQRIRSKPDSR